MKLDVAIQVLAKNGIARQSASFKFNCYENIFDKKCSYEAELHVLEFN